MQYEQTLYQLALPDADEQKPRPTITRHDLLDCDGSAFYLRGVLTQAECQFFIDQAESIGFEDCGYSVSIRCTDRVAAKSETVAAMLFDRIKPFLEPCIDLTNNNEWPTGVPSTFRRWQWYPIGLNEVFRICRYEPGGFFKPHHDGGFCRSEFDRSIKTFMIYLNDDFVGGATNFYDKTQRHYQQGDPNKVVYSFKPQAGDALVFNSAITHDGSELQDGLKYIMRSEIMYSPLLQEPPKVVSSFEPDHDDVDFGPD